MYKFKKMLSVLIFSFILFGCESELQENQIKIDFTSDDLAGENYQDVMQRLQSDGFTNIDVIILDDLITGWLTKDGEVEQVTINENLDYTSGSIYNNDAYVVITYHTFPEVTEEENYDEEESYTDETEPVLETLTIENNEDLAYLLTHDDYSFNEQFAEEYYGQYIEFDGNICYMANHDDYETRYDMLICAGDYDENSQVGPSFKYEDINISYDFNITGENQPENIGIGDNFHFVATVLNFNKDTGLFYLDPVSSQLR